jgi:mono/diheme cytochrome c family protein
LAALLAGVAASGCRTKDTPPADAQVLQRGQQVYAQSCAACHGALGEGAPDWKRRLQDGSYPAPPHDSTGHTWHHADGLLYRVVTLGGAGALTGAGAGAYPSRMPAFGDVLPHDDVAAVLAYIRTMWTPAQRVSQAQASTSDPLPGRR